MDASEVQADSNRKKRSYRGKACGNCRYAQAALNTLSTLWEFNELTVEHYLIAVAKGFGKLNVMCLRRPGRPNVAGCQYPNAGPFESQNLEADIRNKEALLKELEEPFSDDSTVKLSLPYVKEYAEPLHINQAEVHRISQLNDENVNLAQVTSSNPLEPLIDNFMKFATEFGFFLHIPHFRHSALLPEGHRDKPHKGLLSIVQLLGHHLRREQNKKSHDSQEHTFLSLAMLHQPNIISSSHPNKVVHAIQAEILLGMYFYHAFRPSTAKYHLNAALAMALAAGAHKICIYDTTLLQYPAGKDLDEERHRIMEGEKINGFWVALSLNVCLVVALHSPIDEILLLQTQMSSFSIDTPWPMDIQSYATVSFFSTSLLPDLSPTPRAL
ncbi:hypothetical protein C8R41DRAFT_967520 [Lentinula lateritia]|uniref:Transcription factor domain-containing protein n=1 Tax=Lentinula lateritia TaxID=40482 RepID=A0ABQ8V9X4_9AGAR|nr:hypothetical protein C8R41DRAFT_967520 [Lentinula lateritia]